VPGSSRDLLGWDGPEARPHTSKSLIGFAGDKYCLGRVDSVDCREAGLVDGEAGSSARIDVEQGLFERDVAKGSDEGHVDLVSGDRDLHLIAALIAELHKIFGADVGDDITEGAVERDCFSREAFVIYGCGLQIEADQLLDDGADLGPVVAAGEVSAYGGKDIAAMEGGGNFRPDHPVGIGNFANTFDAVAILDHGHQAVVGQNEELTALRFHNYGLARTAYGGIDDHYENGTSREVGCGAKQEARAVSNRKRIDLMREIDDAEIGRDTVHDAFAESDGIVDHSEIGHEDYRGRGRGRGLRENWSGDQKHSRGPD
jgi:hypothetical protein